MKHVRRCPKLLCTLLCSLNHPYPLALINSASLAQRCGGKCFGSGRALTLFDHCTLSPGSTRWSLSLLWSTATVRVVEESLIFSASVLFPFKKAVLRKHADPFFAVVWEPNPDGLRSLGLSVQKSTIRTWSIDRLLLSEVKCSSFVAFPPLVMCCGPQEFVEVPSCRLNCQKMQFFEPIARTANSYVIMQLYHAKTH